MSGNKDMRQLLARVRKQGFAIELGGSGHYRITAPCGQRLTVPSTPSGGKRALANARASLKRLGAQL